MYFETSDLKIHFLMIPNSEITIEYPYGASYSRQHQYYNNSERGLKRRCRCASPPEPSLADTLTIMFTTYIYAYAWRAPGFPRRQNDPAGAPF